MFIGAFGGDRIRKCPPAQSPAALESLPAWFCPDILSSKANVISATQYRHELDLLWTRLMSTQMAVIGGSIGLRGWLPDAI